MAEESTSSGERMNRPDVPEKIAVIEEEIERTRNDASATIREIKSRTAEFARTEIRARIANASDKASNAAAKTAEAAWKRLSRLRTSLNKVDKKTALYVAGGMIAAGSLVSAASFVAGKTGKGRHRYPALPK
jgi:hypothetical protein